MPLTGLNSLLYERNIKRVVALNEKQDLTVSHEYFILLRIILLSKFNRLFAFGFCHIYLTTVTNLKLLLKELKQIHRRAKGLLNDNVEVRIEIRFSIILKTE